MKAHCTQRCPKRIDQTTNDLCRKLKKTTISRPIKENKANTTNEGHYALLPHRSLIPPAPRSADREPMSIRPLPIGAVNPCMPLLASRLLVLHMLPPWSKTSSPLSSPSIAARRGLLARGTGCRGQCLPYGLRASARRWPAPSSPRSTLA